MMKTLFTTIAAIGAVVMIAGPAAAKTWQQCDYEARQYALSQTNPGGATVGSAIAGGLLGLGISSITGNTNTAGAVIAGTVAGGAAGLVLSTAKQQQLYNAYMAQCTGGVPQPQPQPIVNPQPSTFPPPGQQAGVYQALNVRVCPQASNQCPSIGTIQPGSFVPVNGCTAPANSTSGWCLVGIPQGWGWSSRQYLYF